MICWADVDIRQVLDGLPEFLVPNGAIPTSYPRFVVYGNRQEGSELIVRIDSVRIEDGVLWLEPRSLDDNLHGSFAVLRGLTEWSGRREVMTVMPFTITARVCHRPSLVLQEVRR